MAEAACWWLAVSFLGLLALPLVCRLLGRLPGRGLFFARPLGLLLAGWFFWQGQALGLLSNNLTGVWVAIILLAILSAACLRRAGDREILLQTLRNERARLLVSELLFILGLAAWTALRAYSAERIQPSGGEKFMEIAFLNSILADPSFPPQDPWFAGMPIAYYYFGYVHMAFLARLMALPSGVAFELYGAMIPALTLQLAYALASELAVLSAIRRGWAHLAGLTAACFTALTGNLQGFLEGLHSVGWLSAGVAGWLSLPGFPPSEAPSGTFFPGYSWWWWRASRILNDLDLSGRPLAVPSITEFPFFSFLLGDNHPHVLAVPFVFLCIALALDAAVRGSLRSLGLADQILRLLASALVLGSLIFLNTWDFPIYLGLYLLAFLGGQFARRGLISRDDILETAARAAAVLLGSVLFYLSFLLHFTSQAGGLLPYVFPPTRLVQFLVMFLPFLYILAFFLPAALARRRSAPWGDVAVLWLRLILSLAVLFLVLLALAAIVLSLDQANGGVSSAMIRAWLGGDSTGEIIIRILAARLNNPWLFLVLSLLISLGLILLRSSASSAQTPSPPPDIGLTFAVLLAAAGLFLTLMVEFVYLRDLFGVRMNTVFKFYFQAWLMLACSCGYALAWMIVRASRLLRMPFLAGTAILLGAALVYPILAVRARTHDLATIPTLDGTAGLRAAYPDDFAAIDWLRDQTSAGAPPVILEATCSAYCFAGRIAAFSGSATLLGWSSHEAQWRPNNAELTKRQNEIAAIYRAASSSSLLTLLRSRRIDYVVLGSAEAEYILELCREEPDPCSPQHTRGRFETLLIPAFRSGEMTIYAVP